MWSEFSCKWRCLIATAAVAVLSIHASAQKTRPQKAAAPALGVQIVSSGNEPELRVGGVPFFVHAAQFDYFRIPPDLWALSLDRYRELGINTIDLRIPWNWHEPRDAEFDFDGHTNPRRNLRTVLMLIAQKRLKLIVRPGPLIGDHWRNAGYPPWLLAYSDFKMSPAAIEKGEAPREAQLAATDGNAAARAWLANEVHMTYARRWMTAVAKELAPFSAKNAISITEPGDRESETQENDIAGPLLFVALDDVLAIRSGPDAPDLSRYLAELRRALLRGGLDAMAFLNVPDVVRQGVEPFRIGLPSHDQTQAGLAGQWFFQPSSQAVSLHPASPGPPQRDSLLATTDAASLALLATSLGTQPDFPPFLSGFAVTTFAPAGDLRVNRAHPENTLLASRLLLGNGIRAFEYSPLQDTLTPAGWETLPAGRYFRWDAALDLAGNRGPGANGVARNGQFISSWGAMLASSHPPADFAIVDLRVCASAGDDATSSRNARAVEESFGAAIQAGFAPELVNPAAQSVDRLLRSRLLLLPVPEEDTIGPKLQEKAQAAIAEFVRRGGSLIDIRVSATEKLPDVLRQSGIVPGLRRSGSAASGVNLFVTQLISNELAASVEQPQTCVEGQLCAAALISVTNISPDEAASETLEMTDSRPVGRHAVPPKISFDVTVPARESLLLPVHAPLCSAVLAGEHCTDEIIVAGAELLGAQRDGKTLELTFYAPARAMVRLHLESEPSKVELDQNIRLEDQWKPETGELEVSLLRGAAPDYKRVLQIHLRYTPHVGAKSDLKKNGYRGSEYDVFDAVRFPLAGNAMIPTSPPLIPANPGSGGSAVIASWNHSDDMRLADFDFEGAFHGTGSARMFGREQVFTRLRFQPARNSSSENTTATPASDGLLHGSLAIRSGREHANAPVSFIAANDAGNAHYQYDFDRDGAPEWVLESARLRLIVSPADGGRALALVDKSRNDDLIMLGGALHDFLVPGGGAPTEASALGDFSFNRAYHAGWIEEKQDAGLRLTYSEFENSDAGLHVEKTLRLTTPETVEASYQVSDVASAFSTSSGNSIESRSFISMLSVPVPAMDEGNTRFCWESSASSASSPAPTAAKTAVVPADLHCQDFVSSGPPIMVPDGTTRIKIESPGRPALALEWTSGLVILVPRASTAELNLVVPLPASTHAPVEFKLRYILESAN